MFVSVLTRERDKLPIVRQPARGCLRRGIVRQDNLPSLAVSRRLPGGHGRAVVTLVTRMVGALLRRFFPGHSGVTMMGDITTAIGGTHSSPHTAVVVVVVVGGGVTIAHTGGGPGAGTQAAAACNSVSKRSIRRFVITEKAPSRAFS